MRRLQAFLRHDQSKQKGANRMKTYEALANAFIDEGTSAVFGLMGSTNQHWMNSLYRRGIAIYDVRHEGPGLAMAEAAAIINGQPGVCTTTSGPGVTQLATAMIAASRSRTPLIAFCGDERWGDDGHTHALDHARFAAAIECGFLRITSPANAYEVTQKAFYLTRTESRPIMLSVPLDVQLAGFDDLDEYTPSLKIISQVPPAANLTVLREAVDIVASSSHPVIVVGRGAIRSGAQEVTLRLAERIGALITTSLMAMNWPPGAGEYHVGVSGLFSTRAAMEFFQDADCVIAVGASLNHYTIEYGYLYPNARIVQVDVQPQVVMGDGRLADCYVQSDARLGLEAIESLLETRAFYQAGYRTVEVQKQLATAFDDSAIYDIEPGTLDVREVCKVLDEAMPDDIGLVIAGAHSAETAIMASRASRPFILVNKYFGSMSKGIAAVIGSAVTTGKPAALIEGDAGFMMYLSEFETAVRHQIPVFVAILNDQALGAELHHHALTDEMLDPRLTQVTTPDLGKIGIALGGRGRLVQTIEGLRAAIAEFVAQPGPTLVDIRISQSVESIPARRLHGHEEI